MDKPNIQLLLISIDVQERQTLNPNLHLVGWVGDNCNVCGRVPSCARFQKMFMKGRVAELGSLSSGAKSAMKIFVFTNFVTNASFLRVIANLQI